MGNVNFNELFGSFTAADALAATEENKTTGFRRENLYQPKITDEKCADGNYRALIRFIPFYYEGKWRTIISRWECFLRDVNGENGIFVVSPKTNGKSCPMRNLSYKLYKSESAIDRENSKKINVYQQYYALIEVVKDIQHPEYNGKWFIYQFGQKINDKIENAMKDTEFTQGFNPFDFYNGRLFEINITKDASKKIDGTNKPVANYDACGFTMMTAPIHFPVGEDVQTLIEGDKDSGMAFFNWLENDAPKIKDYFWKEWDTETQAKVNANLATYTSGYVAPRNTAAAAQQAVADATNAPAPAQQPAPAPITLEDMPDFTGGAQTPQAPAAVPEIPADEEETNISADDNDWINNVLNG